MTRLVATSLLLLLLVLQFGASYQWTCMNNITLSLGNNARNHRDTVVCIKNDYNVNISNIRVSCGDFIDKWAVDPRYKMKRIGPEECIVNQIVHVPPGATVAYLYKYYSWIFKRIFNFKLLGATCGNTTYNV